MLNIKLKFTILKTNYLDFLKKLDNAEGHESYLEKIVDAWYNQEAADSSISGINSHQYVLRVLNILSRELKTYSASILGASAGIFQYFFNKKVEINSQEIEQIAAEYLAIQRLPNENISQQPDDYRSMLLNVGGDLRSVLISLAENILLLRFYNSVKDAKKQKSIIDLSKHVFIPIAHQLGFYRIKSSMEDLVLSHEEPKVYYSIKQKLKESENKRQEIIKAFIEPIQKDLAEHGMKFRIKGRTKSIQSIYTKMKKQAVTFEKVFDLWAIRIIIDSELVNEKADCWHAFSVVTNLYTPSLSRLRDWISIPRDNGYESLHITVQTQDKNWIEVQIRTERMDDEAENGMAAHWRYKGGKTKHSVDFWLANIRKALESETQVVAEDDFRTAKFSNDLFVFTPKGDLKKLNIGATVLDFAFAIHSDVGLKCVGGIVNGKNVGMKHLLRNGDQVQILTSKSQKPSLDWLTIVTSNRARNRIKKAFDEQGQREAEQGKEVLLRRLKNWKIDFNQDVLSKLISHFNFKNISDLYRAIYHEKIDVTLIKKVLTEEEIEKPKTSNETFAEISEQFVESTKNDTSEKESNEILIIDQLDNVNYSLAKCCNPIPGDAIFGFVTVSKGISIHRRKCPNAREMKSRYPYRFIPCQWKTKEDKTNFRAEIFIAGINKSGIYSEISSLISKQMGIHILNMNLNGDGQYFQGKITVKVYDTLQLDTVLQKLQGVEGVKDSYRYT